MRGAWYDGSAERYCKVGTFSQEKEGGSDSVKSAEEFHEWHPAAM